MPSKILYSDLSYGNVVEQKYMTAFLSETDPLLGTITNSILNLDTTDSRYKRVFLGNNYFNKASFPSFFNNFLNENSFLSSGSDFFNYPVNIDYTQGKTFIFTGTPGLSSVFRDTTLPQTGYYGQNGGAFFVNVNGGLSASVIISNPYPVIETGFVTANLTKISNSWFFDVNLVPVLSTNTATFGSSALVFSFNQQVNPKYTGYYNNVTNPCISLLDTNLSDIIVQFVPKNDDIPLLLDDRIVPILAGYSTVLSSSAPMNICDTSVSVNELNVTSPGINYTEYFRIKNSFVLNSTFKSYIVPGFYFYDSARNIFTFKFNLPPISANSIAIIFATLTSNNIFNNGYNATFNYTFSSLSGTAASALFFDRYTTNSSLLSTLAVYTLLSSFPFFNYNIKPTLPFKLPL